MRHSSRLFFEGVSSKFLIGEGSGFWDLLLRLAPIEQLCSLWQISAACLFLMTDQQMEIVTWEKIISPRASAEWKFYPGEEFCLPTYATEILPWGRVLP